MKKKVLILLVMALAVRLLMLDSSTHFLSDESRDLVNMHQIWVEKKLTLVGPISDDRSHVFSSLTYYMLLPFAIIYNFDPLGPVAGAAFWGILTWGVTIWLIFKSAEKLPLTGLLLATVWWPLVQTSRWPWNPNLQLFWLFSGLILKGVPAGLALGLASHHHYLALLPVSLIIIKKRDWKMMLGAVSAIIPFFVFDLRHPPGIFIGRMIDYNKTNLSKSVFETLSEFPKVISFFVEYIFQHKELAMLGLAGIVILTARDLIKKNSARGWGLIWVLTLVPLTVFSRQFHYLLPAVPFFTIWLITPRDRVGNRLAGGILWLLIFGSMINLSRHFQQPDWSGNLKLIRGAEQIIREQIRSQNLKNPNLAVLSSPDIYPAGKRYRDLLLVNEIRIRPYEEYEFSDNLFVITKSFDTELRQDPAAEMLYFRNGPVRGVWEIPNTEWRVVQFNRY